MKCLCGYEYNRACQKEDEKGDEEFIYLEESFHIVDNTEYFKKERKVYLVVCPKCGTVQMSKW